MDIKCQESAPKIHAETLAGIQDLIMSMDMRLARASATRPLLDQKIESRLQRTIAALTTIRDAVDNALDD